jgi:hypothetical protein
MKHPFIRVLGGPEQFWSAKHQVFVKRREHFHRCTLHFNVIVRRVMTGSSERIYLEEPVRVASPARINLEEP